MKGAIAGRAAGSTRPTAQSARYEAQPKNRKIAKSFGNHPDYQTRISPWRMRSMDSRARAVMSRARARNERTIGMKTSCETR
jgi:hypothetical protein